MAKLAAIKRKLRTTNASAFAPRIVAGTLTGWAASVAADPGGRCDTCCYLGSVGKGRLLGVLLAGVAAIFAIVPTAFGETTHTYAVTLTITVDRTAHKIDGTVGSDAPGLFCELSTVRIRKVMPGHDKVVGRLTPYGNEWHMKSPPALRGERIYAEVSTYHLPGRPVECLGARSRTVTAP
jgi:hypothetical protein